MKKIIYANPKETIELSYPDWLSPFMKIVWRHLKVKTIKLSNGAKITRMVFDEVVEFRSTPKGKNHFYDLYKGLK